MLLDEREENTINPDCYLLFFILKHDELEFNSRYRFI